MDHATLPRKIDHIALHSEYNNQAMSDMCMVKLKLHLVDLLSTYYMNKFCQQIKLIL